jgi:mono/diheme cytochrome c family protein
MTMKRILLPVALLLVVLLGLTLYLGLSEDKTDAVTPPPVTSPEAVERGAYLARVGNCMACHTTRGGADYAGGRGIQTPFGTIYSSNLTPDADTGIGAWSADDFWRAMHNGKSRDGSLLYPAFPYPNYSKVTRADSDAMYLYLKTLQPVAQANRTPELRFPYNQRILLAAWRALYFRPEVHRPQQAQGVEWNRGAYLVEGLGHCSACHTERNALGATRESDPLGGGLIPILNWYAPSLTSADEAWVGGWETQQIISLLKTGVSERAAASGPMAEVVRESLQHLSDSDVQAMAVYLKALPQTEAPARRGAAAEDSDFLRLGAKLYEEHCVSCHQANGQGEPPGFPPLAGNRAVVMSSAVNPIRMVLHGGYPPSTQGNPRPYGMPPFGSLLSDQEVAAVVSYTRNAWGNQASIVSPADVQRYRSVPLD